MIMTSQPGRRHGRQGCPKAAVRILPLSVPLTDKVSDIQKQKHKAWIEEQVRLIESEFIKPSQEMIGKKTPQEIADGLGSEPRKRSPMTSGAQISSLCGWTNQPSSSATSCKAECSISAENHRFRSSKVLPMPDFSIGFAQFTIWAEKREKARTSPDPSRFLPPASRL